ncbi:MAG: response regulator, partial [Alphaproteobacteria bacterium]
MTICVVDDDRHLLRAMDRLLSMSGFRVAAFASSDEFLASNKWVTAACIVMDVRLGRTSGIELH